MYQWRYMIAVCHRTGWTCDVRLKTLICIQLSRGVSPTWDSLKLFLNFQRLQDNQQTDRPSKLHFTFNSIWLQDMYNRVRSSSQVYYGCLPYLSMTTAYCRCSFYTLAYYCLWLYQCRWLALWYIQSLFACANRVPGWLKLDLFATITLPAN